MPPKMLGRSDTNNAAASDLDALLVLATNGDANATEALDSYPQTDGRTVASLSAYLANNAVFNVKDFGAVGNGVADDTVAVQAAVTALAAGERLVFPAGATFLLTANITKTGVDDLTIDARGATLSAPDSALTGVFSFTSCDRLTWEGGYFLGDEDNTYFQANTPSDERSFIDLDTCERATIRGIRGKDKRRLLVASTSHYLRIDDFEMVGFFQDISLGVVANANWAPAISLLGCDFAHVSRGLANNCSTIVLGGLSGEHVTVDQMVGSNLHDTGVYCSSGFEWTISNVSVRACAGTAVTTRGARMTITNIEGRDLPFGYAVHMTGLNLSTDAFGADADGYNLVCSNVSAFQALGAVSAGLNGTRYPRDIVVSNVAAYDSVGVSDTDSPIELIAIRGISLANVIIRTTGSDMGVLAGGPDAGNPCIGVTIHNAQVSDVNGSAASTRGGIRVQFATNAVTTGCVFDDIDSLIGVRYLGVAGGVIANNRYDGGQVFRVPTGESNTGVLAIGNSGTSSAVFDTTANTARDNIGFVTENNGTATVLNATTSIVVNHGLAATPALQDISVTPTNNLGTAAKFWISTVTATQFTINVDADPGVATATFAWTASIQ